jgi:ABC-type transporter Mla MlaB component
MLQITREVGSRSQTVLRIEGSLVAEGVGRLLRECFAALRTSEVLRLDLEGVDFVDYAGIEALGRLARAGVEIRSPPGSVASVLEDEDVLVPES